MINWKGFVKKRSWATEARSWHFPPELSEKKNDESGKLISWSILGTGHFTNRRAECYKQCAWCRLINPGEVKYVVILGST